MVVKTLQDKLDKNNGIGRKQLKLYTNTNSLDEKKNFPY